MNTYHSESAEAIRANRAERKSLAAMTPAERYFAGYITDREWYADDPVGATRHFRYDPIEGVTPPQLDEAGRFGFGRCARCGESFREDDAQAEVCGTNDDPSARILDSLIIHADCITDNDVLA